MTGPQHPHHDDAARRVGEALQAQARGRPVPPRASGPPPAPPRVPGRVPPPAPRPVPPAARQRPAPVASAPARAAATPRGSATSQILWAALITLLVGALLGGGIALVSVLLPGALPALG